MKILVIESQCTLKEERKEQLKAEIREDIKNGGFVFLNGQFRSYVAEIDDVKISDEMPHEVKGIDLCPILDCISNHSGCICKYQGDLKITCKPDCPAYISRCAD